MALFIAKKSVGPAVPVASLNAPSNGQAKAAPTRRSSVPRGWEDCGDKTAPRQFTPEKHFIGLTFRKATTATLGVPAAAVRRVAMDVVRPATTGVAEVASAVAGPVVGVVGGLLGAVIGTLGLAPVAGTQRGYALGRGAATSLLHAVADLLAGTVDLCLAALAALLRQLGWLVGAVLTAPLMVFGRH